MIRVYSFGRNERTHKEVGITEIVADADSHGIDTISVISSGNYLGAILRATKRTGLRVVNLVNWPIGSKSEELMMPPRRILRDAAEREAYVCEQIEGAGNVRDYTDFVTESLKKRANKILESKPGFVGLGIGSGKLFVTLADAIEARGLETKLIGFVPQGENGVFNDDNLFEEGGLWYYKNYEPKSLADKLCTPYTFFKPRILNAMSRGHNVLEVSDKDFMKANQEARRQGFSAEVSGSAGFILHDENVRQYCGIKNEDDVLLINTGNGRGPNLNLLRLRRAGVGALALAASVLLGYGALELRDSYRFHKFSRQGAINLATNVASRIGEEIQVDSMSTEELFAYVDSPRVQNKIGGPPWYR